MEVFAGPCAEAGADAGAAPVAAPGTAPGIDCLAVAERAIETLVRTTNRAGVHQMHLARPLAIIMWCGENAPNSLIQRRNQKLPEEVSRLD